MSTPVTWAEVAECAAERHPGTLTFLAEDVLARLERDGDVFADVLTLQQELPV